MKRVSVLFLTFVMCLAMTGCKSEEAKEFETLFKAIGEVSLEAEDAIVAAEAAYEELLDEDKTSVQETAEMLAEMRSYHRECRLRLRQSPKRSK